MEPYVDLIYYNTEFKGTIIPESSFDRVAREASRKVGYFTCGRIDNPTTCVKDATCSIAELLYEQAKLKSGLIGSANNKSIISETMGPRSVTYENNGQYRDKQIKTDRELDTAIYQICKEYLRDTNLLERGI